MRVLLMHPDRDFDAGMPPPSHTDDLIADLELDTLLEAMGAEDRFIGTVSRIALLQGLEERETIGYRQAALRDCLEHPDVIRELYAVTLEGLQSERRHWAPLQATPQSITSRSLAVLGGFIETLARLRQIAETSAPGFRSPAFQRLFEMLGRELSDEYLGRVRDQLEILNVERGSLISMRLGPGNKGIDHVLRVPESESLLERVSPFHRRGNSFEVAERDQAGVRALSEIADRGLNAAANALAQSVEHIVSFLHALLTELGFYIGCLNLHDRLAERGQPTCMPVAADEHKELLSARGLFDIPLTLRLEGPVVGNDLDADGRRLVVITGANRGGKSTLLRAIGVAQLMLQCGMFVAAEEFSASVHDCVLTHFKHEEDASMTSGKLVEELKRMSGLVDDMGPGSMLLCNESFASTNEREGSEIGRQVLRALIEAGVRIVFVTHMYDLAHTLQAQAAETALFLRADPEPDGERSFKVRPGDPLPTSYGIDTYRRVFAGA